MFWINLRRTAIIIAVILMTTFSAVAQQPGFITLTDIHGHPIVINVSHLQSVRAYEEDELDGRSQLSGKTQIVTTKGAMAVSETPDQILKKIRDCGCASKVPK